MILVTGANGFIGSHLTEELAKRKEKIRALVRDAKKTDNLNEMGNELKNRIEIFEGDLLNKDSMKDALRKIDRIFHLAAISRPMNIPRKKYFDVNVQGTKNLMEACKKQKVKKIIHVSSMSVFGFSRDGKSLNEMSPKLPISDYGESKKQGEEFAKKFCKENRINLVVVRPPMVFGPRDFQFLKLFRLINTGFFPLLKKGKAKLEFCYVKNLVNGILLADKYGKNLEDYNLSDGQTYSIKEVFEKIAYLENKKLLPVSLPIWSVKISGLFAEKIFGLFGKKAPFNQGTAEWMSKNNIVDISKAKKKLKYSRLIPLENSIKETIKWYKSRGLL